MAPREDLCLLAVPITAIAFDTLCGKRTAVVVSDGFSSASSHPSALERAVRPATSDLSSSPWSVRFVCSFVQVERTLATIHDFGSQQLWNCVCGSDFILRPAVRHEQVRVVLLQHGD